MAGDTYTILLTGPDTAGRYCLIDMLVPPGGGPPPHRHDFEEMFSVLEGQIEVTFRGQTLTVHDGETINVPVNAPHTFRNAAERPARRSFFAAIGDPIASRATPAPRLSESEQAERIEKILALAPRFKTEILI